MTKPYVFLPGLTYPVSGFAIVDADTNASEFAAKYGFRACGFNFYKFPGQDRMDGLNRVQPYAR